MRLIVFLSAMLTSLFGLVPAPAVAQNPPPIYNMPCAGGLPCVSPPPEVMFGTGYSAPGQVFETPAVRGPGYMAQSFAAIAFWQTEDGKHDYAYGSQRASSREEAERYAVRECEYRGGRNCTIGLWGGNGHFAIARSSDGRFHAGFAGRVNQARRLALDACKEVSSGCRVVETVDSTPYYFEF
ncbi:DUF4189 domain-containing protein [Altererythrobacter xixiisoli]|uniref:DUF4189 domain-containing protein n=1 Tax=Croceibacterium xixiisoli TaxID=1476466 RepID=A0A6I4TUA0_9SPHN|nr:DUF4189 domain-containing protein [Croceibacterium xixiisoli]MXO99494.1 DUF4189 domain-containing protein [Croceibacterium xixiisoli]